MCMRREGNASQTPKTHDSVNKTVVLAQDSATLEQDSMPLEQDSRR